MENQNDMWQEKVLNSLDGAKRATPDADLFSKIEAQIKKASSPSISISRLILAGAAAAAILIINFAAVRNNFNQSSELNAPISSEVNYLQSDFNLYE